MRGFDGGGARRHLYTEATCGQVTASHPAEPLYLLAAGFALLLGACSGGGDSFEAAIQAVNESPCQRGGPLYVDIAPRRSQDWRIRSVDHPGKEAYVSDVDWRTSHWDVYGGLSDARNYSGLDEISWASAAVTVVPGCTAARIRSQDIQTARR